MHGHGGGLANGRRSHRTSTASLATASTFGAYSNTSSMATLPAPPSAAQPQHPYPPSLFPLPFPPIAPFPTAAPAAATSGGFQFLRSKGFSVHTQNLLKRLEDALTSHPNSVRAYTDLAEEYRVLGARGAFLRLLEYAHARFPSDTNLRDLLYTHAPTRPRTPPPPEPAISMERTALYDYKWRHQETNLFPKQLLKLDTSVPPLGRQLRTAHLHMVALLKAEEAYESPAARAARRSQELQELEKAERENNLTSNAADIAITIPSHFNKVKGAHGAMLPFAAGVPVASVDEKQAETNVALQRRKPQPHVKPAAAASSAPSMPVASPAAPLASTSVSAATLIATARQPTPPITTAATTSTAVVAAGTPEHKPLPLPLAEEPRSSSNLGDESAASSPAEASPLSTASDDLAPMQTQQDVRQTEQEVTVQREDAATVAMEESPAESSLAAAAPDAAAPLPGSTAEAALDLEQQRIRDEEATAVAAAYIHLQQRRKSQLQAMSELAAALSAAPVSPLPLSAALYSDARG